MEMTATQGFFTCREEELEHIRSVDPLLSRVIDEVGPLRMPLDPDMFTAIVRNIVGQQISIPVYERIWADFQRLFGTSLDPERVIAAGPERLRELGLTVRKTQYVTDIASMFADGRLVDSEISAMDDGEVMRVLDAVRGIGPWTVEMVLLFYLDRRDVFSFGDLALIRGMKRLYGLDELPRELFEEYRRRFSPCGSVAMLYLWEVGEGRVDLGRILHR
ncbi:MAG: DNA-3-methyladenine glycosylase 2 family protein [archaeon]|nr:DNA-3-methyladenine glycosylase 2 family protein [archaeon]